MLFAGDGLLLRFAYDFVLMLGRRVDRIEFEIFGMSFIFVLQVQDEKLHQTSKYLIHTMNIENTTTGA
jgi:hypothetical protein